MPNPNINQGTLNRLRASVLFPAFPALNVSAPFLGKEAIRLTFEGESTVYINTMTGAVTSPEPYLKISMVMSLLKSQALSSAYKAQMELSALLGDCTVRPDSAVLAPYQFFNTSIQNVPALNFSGDDASYNVTIGGYYNINSSLFDI